MTNWRFTDATLRVIFRTLDDGRVESRLALPGDVADPPIPRTVPQEELDAQAARTYPKLVILMQMTPAQVNSWVDQNVLTLADAKDALKTLAIAVSVLARRL